MTTVTIPLDRNPELAALVADKQVGDWIELRASIKAKDGQTLEVRLETCDDCEKPDSEDDEDEEGDEAPPEKSRSAETDAAAEKPSKVLARKLTAQTTDAML